MYKVIDKNGVKYSGLSGITKQINFNQVIPKSVIDSGELRIGAIERLIKDKRVEKVRKQRESKKGKDNEKTT